MNNKGFAITTILFGTMILFILLFISLLGILSTYKNNLQKIIDSGNGAREKVTILKQDLPDGESFDTFVGKGLYCDTSNNCMYIVD